MSGRDQVARSWHEGSDHAAVEPFGGPLCNCDRVAGRIMPMLADAWADGAMQGHEDHEFGVEEWTNPYETEEDRHVDQ